MRINNNLMAMNTHRQLGVNSTNGAKSIEKLSSGLRINRAGDDAAGLSISEKMRAQVRGLNQASRNAQDGISLIQTAEGALNETHAILQRMRELSVQSATDTNSSDDRGEIQKEVTELATEITRISNNTEFNTQKVLDGTFNGVFHIGANAGQSMSVTVGAMDSTTLQVGTGGAATFTGGTAGNLSNTTVVSALTDITGTYTGNNATGVALETEANFLDTAGTFSGDVTFGSETVAVGTNGSATFSNGLTVDFSNAANGANASTVDFTGATAGAPTAVVGINVSTQTAANTAIGVIDAAVKSVSAQRSQLGAFQNRLEHTIKNLDTSSENLQASESRIRDVDMAKEMMEFTKNNILQQAAQAMLAQANQAPQGVLQLLR